MSILQRYIFREWFWTLLAVSIVLWVVLMGVFVGELLNDIADGRVPTGLLGKQLLLATPEMLSKLLPLAGFVAVMWGLGRLYRDQEMVVMRSSGFNWRYLLRPLFMMTLPVAALLLAITLWAAPKAAALSESLLEEALRSASLWGLQAGRFQVMQSGDLVLYVEQMDREGRRMSNVFVRQKDADRARIWTAREGEYWVDQETGRRYLTLQNGAVTDARPEGRDVRILSFERNDLQLPDPPRRSREMSLESVPLATLLSSTDAANSAELQWRLSPAIAAVILGLLAIPLSHSGPREGRGGRVALGILIYAVYANTLSLCRSWVESETLPAFIGTWWVHGVLLLVALFWLYRQGRMVGSS
ncbi:MAG: LPS export ABC transporter permease LptF [Pseudomonadota bacterium]